MKFKLPYSFAICFGILLTPINLFAQEISANNNIINTEDNYSNLLKIAALSPKPNLTNGLINNKQSELNRLALRFVNFVDETQNAAKIESLSNAQNIANFVDNSPFYTRADTIDGAKALAIISAHKSQIFIENVKNISNFIGKDIFIQKLNENPELIKTIKGYEDAQMRANNVLEYSFAKIENAKSIIAQASYDLQKEKWSIIATDKQPRLEATQAAWNKEINLNDSEFSKLSEFLNLNQTEYKAAKINDKYIIAAAILEISNEENALKIINLNSGKFCANNAYLNLRMCISATKYPFEHTFCLAKHGYEEFENCAKSAIK